jgi:hypothetical protein
VGCEISILVCNDVAVDEQLKGIWTNPGFDGFEGVEVRSLFFAGSVRMGGVWRR